MPAPFDRTKRTHEDAVHIEQHTANFQFSHFNHLDYVCPHAVPEFRAKSRPAASTFCTDAGEQDSAYMRSKGFVPEARSSSHVSAAFGFKAPSGFRRKNLMPSKFSVRSTSIPANAFTPARALAMAAYMMLSAMCRSMRP